ncbi:unnamed protein product [Lactuca virosa]|uniref:Uncharacterized protein n=1 Tax=Lactuca virosa TaxID=75947 RepID=A0AAU9PQF6_9ASTR|nr:unnamed protein product [Lactuca virosa]
MSTGKLTIQEAISVPSPILGRKHSTDIETLPTTASRSESRHEDSSSSLRICFPFDLKMLESDLPPPMEVLDLNKLLRFADPTMAHFSFSLYRLGYR